MEERTAVEVLAAIAAPLPPSAVRSKEAKNNRTGKVTQIRYLAWYDACDLMDQRAPEWDYEVKEVGAIGGKTWMRVRVYVNHSTGAIQRDATGCEDSATDSFGDPFSNAESMALRRAFVKFGLGRELYRKGAPAPRDPKPKNTAQTEPQAETIGDGVRGKCELAIKAGDASALPAIRAQVLRIEQPNHKAAATKWLALATLMTDADGMTPDGLRGAREAVMDMPDDTPGKSQAIDCADAALAAGTVEVTA